MCEQNVVPDPGACEGLLLPATGVGTMCAPPPAIGYVRGVRGCRSQLVCLVPAAEGSVCVCSKPPGAWCVCAFAGAAGRKGTRGTGEMRTGVPGGQRGPAGAWGACERACAGEPGGGGCVSAPGSCCLRQPEGRRELGCLCWCGL